MYFLLVTNHIQQIEKENPYRGLRRKKIGNHGRPSIFDMDETTYNVKGSAYTEKILGGLSRIYINFR
jgi:hypothetical protein